MPITPQDLRAKAANESWSEDFQRFDDNQLQRWIDSSWDDGAQRFRSEKTDTSGNALPGFFEKPSETPEGWGAWGSNFALPNSDPRMGGGGGGGGYGGGGGWGGGGGSWGGSGGGLGAGWSGGSGRSYGTFGGAPNYQWDKFVAPNPQDVANDPSYQFRLGEGTKAIEGSAAAKGLLRTGGTLKDIAGYGQDLASQEYGNMFGRALQGWGANYQGGKDAFAPAYGSWENMQNQALQKYLQKENNIFGLINSPAPMAPGY